MRLYKGRVDGRRPIHRDVRGCSGSCCNEISRDYDSILAHKTLSTVLTSKALLHLITNVPIRPNNSRSLQCIIIENMMFEGLLCDL